MTRHWEGARSAGELWTDQERGRWVWRYQERVYSLNAHPLLPFVCLNRKNHSGRVVHTDGPCVICREVERETMHEVKRPNREKNIMVRMRGEEVELVKADAARNDVTVSEWVRRCLREGRLRLHELAGPMTGGHAGVSSGLSRGVARTNGKRNGAKNAKTKAKKAHAARR